VPTKTVLIADLLGKQIDSPVDWSFGLFPFYGWYHFTQTVKLGSDTVITKATLKMEVKTRYTVLGTEYGNVGFAFRFNDSPIGGELDTSFPHYLWWTGTKKMLTIGVTDKYRALEGETPQVLSVGLASVPPGHHSDITLTAYLELEYSGTEPTPTGSGASQEPTGTESLGDMMSFMINMMMLMMFMSMMMSMMSSMTEMGGS
jgi:hypothetical protein